ncbi:hypothetical protein H4R19_006519 [Coemansia spiralis]|nr:hypothetical protein H4R19_006519 [Coemansia spiralis]
MNTIASCAGPELPSGTFEPARLPRRACFGSKRTKPSTARAAALLPALPPAPLTVARSPPPLPGARPPMAASAMQVAGSCLRDGSRLRTPDRMLPRLALPASRLLIEENLPSRSPVPPELPPPPPVALLTAAAASAPPAPARARLRSLRM